MTTKSKSTLTPDPKQQQEQKEFAMRALLEAPVKNQNKGTSDGFYSKDNRVYYKSRYFLSADRPGSDTPEELLLNAQEVSGSYGELLSASDVATLIADVLNEKRAEFFKNRGIKRTAA
ncbi:MAG: hypothetical protein G01um101456_621 [Parcubacteria group bacterium Gr01-1014_56]|nr:MAG: hypothetical protein G01um101456_621 [Parcubacteria group bacterium Gr01-1014_56]